MTLSQSDGADIQRALLLTGQTSIDGIVTWADAEIESCDVPSNTLIDLAMSRSESQQTVASLLANLVTQPNCKVGIKHACGTMTERVRSNTTDIETAILSIYNYLRDENLLYSHHEFLVFCGLEDECVDIRDGIYGNGDLTVLREPLLDALNGISQS